MKSLTLKTVVDPAPMPPVEFDDVRLMSFLSLQRGGTDGVISADDRDAGIECGSFDNPE
jgi:hypothetical protein